jgi:3-oxoadipate enol-lactonase
MRLVNSNFQTEPQMPSVQVSDGVQLHYELDDFTDPWRPAETVLLHHAAMGSSQRFYAWVPILARQYRVLRFDIRGHGSSTPPDRGSIWTIDRLARDVAEMLNALQIDRVHFAGSSAGGMIGQQFAVDYAPRVRSLALFATKPGMRQSKRDYGVWDRRLEEVGTRRFLSEGVGDRFKPGETPEGFVEWWLDDAGRTPGWAAQSMVRCMAGVDTRPLLPHIAVPTLIVIPGADPMTPIEEVRPMAESIPSARVVTLEGMYHNITDAAPERCARELLAFLGSLPDPR